MRGWISCGGIRIFVVGWARRFCGPYRGGALPVEPESDREGTGGACLRVPGRVVCQWSLMESTVIYIRNMVCDRCVMVVRDLLREMGMEPSDVRLGEAVLARPLSAAERVSLDEALRRLGFALIDGRRERLAERIRTLIIELVHRENGDLRVNLSDYLSDRLRHDYDYLSGIFSAVEGTTVEKYFIAQKIERVKELLAYDELSLGEIAGMLNYSSPAHLSAQFKRVTGLSPSAFRRSGRSERLPLDKV